MVGSPLTGLLTVDGLGASVVFAARWRPDLLRSAFPSRFLLSGPLQTPLSPIQPSVDGRPNLIRFTQPGFRFNAL